MKHRKRTATAATRTVSTTRPTTTTRPTVTNNRVTDVIAAARNGADPVIPVNAHIGRYGGSFGFDGCDRIVAFQNRMMADNVAMRLTDVQLAIVFCVNHPRSHGTMHAGTVTGIRRDFNAGRHGNPTPDVPSPRFPAVTPDGAPYRLRPNGVPVGHDMDRAGFITRTPATTPTPAA